MRGTGLYRRDRREAWCSHESEPGLASCFPETLLFYNTEVDACCRLLEAGLKDNFSKELTPEATGELRDIITPRVQTRLRSCLYCPFVVPPEISLWIMAEAGGSLGTYQKSVSSVSAEN